MIETTHISKVLNVVCCADERQRRLNLLALQHFLWLKAVRFMARGEKYLQISISCVSSVYLKRLTYTHSGHTGIKEQWIQESTQSQVTRKAQGPSSQYHAIQHNTMQYCRVLQGPPDPTTQPQPISLHP